MSKSNNTESEYPFNFTKQKVFDLILKPWSKECVTKASSFFNLRYGQHTTSVQSYCLMLEDLIRGEISIPHEEIARRSQQFTIIHMYNLLHPQHPSVQKNILLDHVYTSFPSPALLFNHHKLHLNAIASLLYHIRLQYMISIAQQEVYEPIIQSNQSTTQSIIQQHNSSIITHQLDPSSTASPIATEEQTENVELLSQQFQTLSINSTHPKLATSTEVISEDNNVDMNTESFEQQPFSIPINNLYPTILDIEQQYLFHYILPHNPSPHTSSHSNHNNNNTINSNFDQTCQFLRSLYSTPISIEELLTPFISKSTESMKIISNHGEDKLQLPTSISDLDINFLPWKSFLTKLEDVANRLISFQSLQELSISTFLIDPICGPFVRFLIPFQLLTTFPNVEHPLLSKLSTYLIQLLSIELYSPHSPLNVSEIYKIRQNQISHYLSTKTKCIAGHPFTLKAAQYPTFSLYSQLNPGYIYAFVEQYSKANYSSTTAKPLPLQHKDYLQYYLLPQIKFPSAYPTHYSAPKFKTYTPSQLNQLSSQGERGIESVLSKYLTAVQNGWKYDLPKALQKQNKPLPNQSHMANPALSPQHSFFLREFLFSLQSLSISNLHQLYNTMDSTLIQSTTSTTTPSTSTSTSTPLPTAINSNNIQQSINKLHADYCFETVTSAAISKERVELFQTTIQRIAEIVQSFSYGKITVIPYGSVASGLATSSSDIDLRLAYVYNLERLDPLLPLLEPVPRSKAKTILKGMYYNPLTTKKSNKKKYDDDEEMNYLQYEVLVPPTQPDTSRVLLLSIYTEDGVTVDISASNDQPVCKSEYFLSFIRYSPVVYPLLTLAKSWAKKRSIADAALGYLNSYSICLLMFFFLQIKGILPTLQYNTTPNPHIISKHIQNEYFDQFLQPNTTNNGEQQITLDWLRAIYDFNSNPRDVLSDDSTFQKNTKVIPHLVPPEHSIFNLSLDDNNSNPKPYTPLPSNPTAVPQFGQYNSESINTLLQHTREQLEVHYPPIDNGNNTHDTTNNNDDGDSDDDSDDDSSNNNNSNKKHQKRKQPQYHLPSTITQMKELFSKQLDSNVSNLLFQSILVDNPTPYDSPLSLDTQLNQRYFHSLNWSWFSQFSIPGQQRTSTPPLPTTNTTSIQPHPFPQFTTFIGAARFDEYDRFREFDGEDKLIPTDIDKDNKHRFKLQSFSNTTDSINNDDEDNSIQTINNRLNNKLKVNNRYLDFEIPLPTLLPREDPIWDQVVILLREFFCFYGYVFNPQLHAVSTRLGYLVWLGDYQQLNRQHNFQKAGRTVFYIEDPFDPIDNCARAVISQYRDLIFFEFRRAAVLLMSNTPIHTVLQSVNCDQLQFNSMLHKNSVRVADIHQQIFSLTIFSKFQNYQQNTIQLLIDMLKFIGQTKDVSKIVQLGSYHHIQRHNNNEEDNNTSTTQLHFEQFHPLSIHPTDSHLDLMKQIKRTITELEQVNDHTSTFNQYLLHPTFALIKNHIATLYHLYEYITHRYLSCHPVIPLIQTNPEPLPRLGLLHPFTKVRGPRKPKTDGYPKTKFNNNSTVSTTSVSKPKDIVAKNVPLTTTKSQPTTVVAKPQPTTVVAKPSQPKSVVSKPSQDSKPLPPKYTNTPQQQINDKQPQQQSITSQTKDDKKNKHTLPVSDLAPSVGSSFSVLNDGKILTKPIPNTIIHSTVVTNDGNNNNKKSNKKDKIKPNSDNTKTQCNNNTNTDNTNLESKFSSQQPRVINTSAAQRSINQQPADNNTIVTTSTITAPLKNNKPHKSKSTNSNNNTAPVQPPSSQQPSQQQQQPQQQTKQQPQKQRSNTNTSNAPSTGPTYASRRSQARADAQRDQNE